MRFNLLFLLSICLYPDVAISQSASHVSLAKKFIASLSDDQRSKAVYKFDDSERYNWHFVPKEDRKGVFIKELSDSQKTGAFDLLKSYLSGKGYEKTRAIMELENVLRVIENRKEGDGRRDAAKYALIFFGEPSEKNAWGWRFEGHHISLSFSTINNKIVSGTPGFMGSNPAIVLSGSLQGKQVLKEESASGFKLVNSLNATQLQKAIIAGETPNDILTMISKEARIEKQEGIYYSELSKQQQELFIQLLDVYVSRYQKKYAADMMAEIKKADINKLRFVWAGTTVPEIGKAHYYRIQGPSIIIEFDNSQNNANHIHTVVRDLKHDFGGDKLLEHYKKGHSH